MARVLMLAAVLLATVAIAAAAGPALPAYVAANIVADVKKDCPVKNVPFDKGVFDVMNIGGMLAVLAPPDVTPACVTSAVSNLAGCATDASLDYSSGCCSKTCAAALQKSVDSGCFKQYAKAVCTNPAGDAYKTGLFNAAVRCTGNAVSCSPDGATIAKFVSASPAASPKAVTTKVVVLNTTALAATPAESPAVEAPTPSPEAPPPTNAAAISQGCSAGLMAVFALVGSVLLLQL